MTSTEAQRAFDDFLEQKGEGVASIEAFAARHPDLRDELLALHAAWHEANPVRSVFEQLTRDGGASDPRISLDSEPKRDASLDSSELLGKVAAMSKGQRYSIKGGLARGGMGVIYKVWDRDLRRTLAMKVVLGRESGREAAGGVDRDRLSRFLEEAQITGQLDHPGIVPVHELGLDSEGRVFFTMRLVRGKDLREIIQEYHSGASALTLPRMLQIVSRICEAMAFAHDKGVVHRDLKPANVMVGRFGEVYVMDWGLAKVVGREDRPSDAGDTGRPDLTRSLVGTDGESEETMEGVVFGTPCYMAPEQARGHHVQIRPWSDVYSVGSILYHVLTGEMPYMRSGEPLHAQAVLALLLQGPPAPIRKIARDVPDELIAICEKAMQREPARRYASMSEMGEDLQAYLEGRVVQAHRTGAVAELTKWVTRNKATAASTAGLIVVLLGASIGFAVQQGRLVGTIQREQQATLVAKDAAEASARQANRRSYLANLIAADASVRTGEIQEAKRRLAACDEELRDWEWRHIAVRADASVGLLEHGDEVLSVAADGDFFRVATGSADCDIRLWSPDSGELISTLEGHAAPVTGLAFSPDGRHLASASVDGSVRLWDTLSERNLLALHGHEGTVTCVAFSPDGKLVVSGGWDGNLRYWNADTGGEARVVEVGEQPITALAYAPDGASVATGADDGELKILPSDGQGNDPGAGPGAGEAAIALGGHAAQVTGLAFSPDGSRLASVSTDGRIAVWNARTGEAELDHDGQDAVFCVAFAPDGERIVAGSLDKTLHVIRIDTGVEEAALAGHDAPPRSIALSADGSRLLSGSADGTARLWAIETSGTGTALSIGEEPVGALALAPDGRRVAAGSLFGGSIRVWDAPSGALLLEIPGGDDGIGGLAFSPDGEWLVAGLEDGAAVLVLDSRTGAGRLPPLLGHEASVAAVAVSPSGDSIASASADQTVRLWDARTGRSTAVLAGHGDAISSVAFAPDGGRLAAGALDGRVLVWSAVDGTALLALEVGDVAVNAVAFSPDGRELATGSRDGVIRTWDSASGEPRSELAGHEGSVNSLAFSPDGARLVSASFDETLLMWDTSSGDALLTLRGHTAPVVEVAYDPLGARVASGSLDGSILVWETTSVARRWIAQRAARLLEQRLSETGTLAGAAASIRDDQQLDEALRAEALALADLR